MKIVTNNLITSQWNILPDNKKNMINKVSLDMITNIEGCVSSFEKELLLRRTIDLSKISAQDQFNIIKSKALELLPEKELLSKLQESKESWVPLKIKFWIDPTWSDVHLGHTVPMIMLNRFQRMWHDIIFIIWDFTAKIWDPTGRISSRPPLTDDDIKNNLSTYSEQIKPFLDLSKVKIVRNSEWLEPIDLKSLIKTLANISASEILQRNDFRTRLSDWSGLSMLELMYPIVMALDSVHLWSNSELWCDIEVGGKDQFLNMKICRQLMWNSWLKKESILSVPILEWTSGDWMKMSKSLNNYIALTHSAEDVYGKIMSIPDKLLWQYYFTLTEISQKERNWIDELMNLWKINPIKIKKMLARILVSILYDWDIAAIEQKRFENKFSKKEYSSLDEIKEILVEDRSIKIIDILYSNWLVNSKWDARRLIQWWWVKITNLDDKKEYKVTDIHMNLLNFNWEIILKYSKKWIIKILK